MLANFWPANEFAPGAWGKVEAIVKIYKQVIFPGRIFLIFLFFSALSFDAILGCEGKMMNKQQGKKKEQGCFKGIPSTWNNCVSNVSQVVGRLDVEGHLLVQQGTNFLYENVLNRLLIRRDFTSFHPLILRYLDSSLSMSRNKEFFYT